MVLSLISEQKYLSKLLVQKAIDTSKKIAIAESCTGGMISSALTSIPRSSEIFDQGLVTYSNKSKVDLLKVKKSTLSIHGAVSKEVVEEMVKGLFEISVADLALSISGVAGPGSLSTTKPEGLVWIGYGLRNQIIHTSKLDVKPIGRDYVRGKSTIEALNLLLESLETL